MGEMKLRVVGLVVLMSCTAYLRGENTENNKVDPKQDQKMIALEKVERTSSFVMSTTLINQHMWRGFASGNAPAIEPYIAWRYKNFSINAWAAYAVNGSYREFDMWATYTWNNFTFGVFDYFCPSKDDPNPRFFNYSNDDTKHLIEYQIQYDGKAIPISIMYAQFIHGFDQNEEGGQNLSRYIELGYTFTLPKGKLKLEVGCTPAKGMYAPQASIFNYGITLEKQMRFSSELSVPAKYKLIYNKETNDVHFTVAFVIE